MAFVLGSALINNSPIAACYQALVSAVFGWCAESKSMLQHYTSDRYAHEYKLLPGVVKVVVAKYDELAPVLLAKPLEQHHFEAYCEWSSRLSSLERKAKSQWVQVSAKAAKSIKLFK